MNTLRDSLDYRFDGIEGYVYPANQPPQPGMVALIRAYHPGRDDNAIFPQVEQANMALQGYAQGVSTLGYVYLNSSGLRPSH